MEKELKELQQWLSAAEAYELPEWKSLPHVPLYMEQVIGYVNDTLRPLTPEDRKLLTSFMVNNYVKAKMISEPVKKKYNETQLGYLIAITALKNTMSMSEISLLIEMDKNLSADKSTLYGFFRLMSKDILSDRAGSIHKKVDAIERGYDISKAAKKPYAEDNLRNSIGLLAFRLSVQSVVEKLIAEMMLSAIAKDLHGENFDLEGKPGAKEARRVIKISKAEAKRLAITKEIEAKEEAKKPVPAKKKGKK